MSVVKNQDLTFLKALSQLAYCNPFTVERIELEKVALGSSFDEAASTWSKHSDWDRERPNLLSLRERCQTLAEQLHKNLLRSSAATSEELSLYEDLVSYLLYDRYRTNFLKVIQAPTGRVKQSLKFWSAFRKDADYFFKEIGVGEFDDYDNEHLFACCFQVCRAFREIFQHIVGTSLPAAQLRARV